MSPTIQPVLPYADEASMALKMAKEIKARLLEVEERRIVNEQKASSLKHKNAEIKYIDGKTVLEGEEDIFIFKEPKKTDLDDTITDTDAADKIANPVNTGGEITPFNPLNDLPSSNSYPGPNNIFELTVEQRYDDSADIVKSKKSLMAIAASIFLVIILSLVAYTTQIQINITEVGALANQESAETRAEKIKQQARQDFRNKITSINRR